MTLSTTLCPSALDELCINTLRFLAVDTESLPGRTAWSPGGTAVAARDEEHNGVLILTRL